MIFGKKREQELAEEIAVNESVAEEWDQPAEAA